MTRCHSRSHHRLRRGLTHLRIETRLINVRFVSVMCVCVVDCVIWTPETKTHKVTMQTPRRNNNIRHKGDSVRGTINIMVSNLINYPVRRESSWDPCGWYKCKEFFLFVYYESRKWELKTRPIYECRYDERLKTKDEESTGWSRTPYGGSTIVHGWTPEVELQKMEKSGQFPDDPVRMNTSLMNSLCNLPDILTTTDSEVIFPWSIWRFIMNR